MTKIPAHTPAPWIHFENSEGYCVQGPNREHVAYCDRGLESDAPSSAEANARLIAAAPALLDAAMALHDQIVSLAGVSSIIDEDLEMGEPLDALRGAIFQATGLVS